MVEDTERRPKGDRHSILAARQLEILEAIACGEPLASTLREVAEMVEEQTGDMMASILLLDAERRVHLGAGPSLPDGFVKAIEGEPIGPLAGSCGTAMHFNKTVITPDIASDPLWETYRDLALAYGLRSSWSIPLVSSEGRVLGSLAQYYREPRDPSPADRQLVDIARHLAEIAIERHQAEATLRNRNAELEALNTRLKEMDRIKSNFVNLVSHELRTPLSAVRGYAEFLEDRLGGPLTEEQATYVTEIQRGAQRLQALLDDLLDFARVDAGTFRLAREEIDLVALVGKTLESLRPLAVARQIALEGPKGEARLSLRADPGRVSQILVNLVGNALKFTPARGRVSVSVLALGAEARVEVDDNGSGIAPEHVPHLFERFYQVDSGNSRGSGGAGLGLPIAKALVEAHGGQIGVTSTPGIGSQFWFTLPMTI